MKAGKYTEEEIIVVLKEGEAGTNTAGLCRNGIAAQPGSGRQSLHPSSLSPVRPRIKYEAGSELVEGRTYFHHYR
jgi:hypothetical protein